MKSDIENDRLANIVLGTNGALDYDAARVRLESAAIYVTAGNARDTAWGQAALLTVAVCASRMFRRGVYIDPSLEGTAIVGGRPMTSLRRQLVEAGCRTDEAPEQAFHLHVGTDAPPSLPQLRCWTDGWTAVVSPRAAESEPLNGNEISGAVAAAIAVSELFRRLVLNDVRACRTTQRLSPFRPGSIEPESADLERLPARIWLLGLGNLGQATLWILGLLPYADPGEVQLVLHDRDIVGPENRDIQILTTYQWIGQKKARAAAEWVESRGFQSTISELRFTENTSRSGDEPNLALVGVDNLDARRWVARADSGFELVLDAGLGASAGELFDFRLHGFPGSRTPDAAWPKPMKPATQQAEPELPPALAKLVAEGRLDKCGATTIAGLSVGAPTTAVAAAAVQVAQACRAIAEGKYCDMVDVTLSRSESATATEFKLAHPERLAYAKSLKRGK